MDMSASSPQLAAADLALACLSDARSLLEPDGWDELNPVSHQMQRTIWAGLRPAATTGGSCSDSPMVFSVRCSGRVRNASAELISATLMDDGFRTWRQNNRELCEIIVPHHLCVVQETVLGTVPNIQRREFVCVCTHADQPGGGKLLVERSIEHDAYTADGRSVRGWRFCAISVQPRPVLTNTPSSSYTNSPACSAGEGSSFGRSANEEVEVTLILQVRCCCFLCPRATVSQTLCSETAPFFFHVVVCVPCHRLTSAASPSASRPSMLSSTRTSSTRSYNTWRYQAGRRSVRGSWQRGRGCQRSGKSSRPPYRRRRTARSSKSSQRRHDRRRMEVVSGGRQRTLWMSRTTATTSTMRRAWTASRVSSAHRRPRYPPRR